MAYKKTTFIPHGKDVELDGVFVPTSEETLAVVNQSTEQGRRWQLVIPALGVAVNEGKRFTSQAKAIAYGRRVLDRVLPLELRQLGDDPFSMPVPMLRSVLQRVNALN